MAKIKIEDIIESCKDGTTGAIDYVKLEEEVAKYFSAPNAEKAEDSVISDYGKFVKNSEDEKAKKAVTKAYVSVMVGIEPGLSPAHLEARVNANKKQLETYANSKYLSKAYLKPISAELDYYVDEVKAGRYAMPDATLRARNAELETQIAAAEAAKVAAEKKAGEDIAAAQAAANLKVAEERGRNVELTNRVTAAEFAKTTAEKKAEEKITAAEGKRDEAANAAAIWRGKSKRNKTAAIALAGALVVSVGLGVGHGIVAGNVKDARIRDLEDENSRYVQTINALEGEMAELQGEVEKLNSDLTKANDAIAVLEDDNAALEAALNSADAAHQALVEIFGDILTDEQLASLKNEDGTVNLEALIGADKDGVLATIAADYLENQTRIGTYELIFNDTLENLGMKTVATDENGNTLYDENGKVIATQTTVDDYRDENGDVDAEALREDIDNYIDSLIKEVNAQIAEIEANSPMQGLYSYTDEATMEELKDLATSIELLGYKVSGFIDSYNELKEEKEELKQVVADKEQEIAEKNQEIADKEQEIADKDKEIAEKDKELEETKDQLKDALEQDNGNSGEQDETGDSQGPSNVGESEEDEDNKPGIGDGKDKEDEEVEEGEISR